MKIVVIEFFMKLFIMRNIVHTTVSVGDSHSQQS